MGVSAESLADYLPAVVPAWCCNLTVAETRRAQLRLEGRKILMGETFTRSFIHSVQSNDYWWVCAYWLSTFCTAMDQGRILGQPRTVKVKYIHTSYIDQPLKAIFCSVLIFAALFVCFSSSFSSGSDFTFFKLCLNYRSPSKPSVFKLLLLFSTGLTPRLHLCRHGSRTSPGARKSRTLLASRPSLWSTEEQARLCSITSRPQTVRWAFFNLLGIWLELRRPENESFTSILCSVLWIFPSCMLSLVPIEVKSGCSFPSCGPGVFSSMSYIIHVDRGTTQIGLCTDWERLSLEWQTSRKTFRGAHLSCSQQAQMCNWAHILTAP